MNRILQSMNLKNYLLLPLLFSVLGLQAQQACLDFEEFPGGPIFGPLLGNVPGDTLFEQDGLIAVAQELVYLNGNSGFETAWIEGEVLQWMDDQFLFMGNNALELIYTEGVQEICFDFFDGGGEENFSVNGSDLIVIADIKDIEGLTFPDVDIEVSLDSTSNAFPFFGTICITGEISSLVVGGQELGVDNVCASIIDNPEHGDCIAFEEMEASSYGAATGTPPGTVFYAENGVNMRLAPVQTLFWTSVYGDLQVRQESSLPDFAMASGNFLEFESINSIYDLTAYPEPIEKITVDYYYAPEGDGTINFAANGTPLLIQFSMQPGFYALAPGVTLEIVPDNNTNTTGQLVFEGNVQSLLIGGVSGLNIDNVCINPSEPCGLTDMFVVAGICNPNGVFDVTVGIEYDGEPTDTLKLFTNGNYQYYLAGDFPLTLSPFVSPTNEMVFEVATGTNPDCSVAAILPAQDCNPDCALEGLVLDGDPICFPGEDFYTVILNPIGAVEGDTLIIYGQQSNVVQTVIYNGQQLLLDLPLNNEQFEVLEVCAFSGSADCCVEVSYDIGCGACFFVEMAIEPLPCDGDSLFYFELDFDILIDLPGNSFKVETSNGFLETFNYDDLPVIVGPVLGFGEPLTVWVNDLDGLCSASQTFISPDCADGCVLGGVNLLIPAAGCNDDGTYNIPMTLENAQNGDTLIVTSTVTGYSEVLIYGFPFNFNLQLSNWPAPSSGTDSLTICFYNQPNCCTDISFPVPCDPPPCDLQAQVEVINCQPNGVITLAVTTNSDIPDEGPFIMIKIGDFNYGLVGVNTTVQVGPIINPGTDELNVIVEQRSGFSNTSVICEISVPVDVSDCNPDCDIPGFEVYPEGCTGLFGSYFAYVDLDEAALDGEPINIYVNGDLYFSNYVGGDITLEIWALDPGDIQDVISICYADNPECCISKGVDALPCYCTDIYEVVAEASPCQGSEYYISLDLIAADFGDYFNLDVDGGYYGSYSFSDLPLQIGPFAGNGEPVDLFAYTDGFCQPGGTTVNAPLCDDGCTVEYAELIGIECDNDLYYAIFQLNAPASPDDTVLVFSQVTNNIGTALVDPFANEILSVTMPLPFEQYDALTICLGDQLDCCFEVDFDVPCGNQGCNLQGILTDPTDCNDDGTYNLVFGVNYDGPPTSFVVSIPGINFNEVYALNELPVTIPNLPGDGDTYQINVEATDCNAFMEALFVAPACEIGCVFNSVIAEPHPCEDGFFMVDIEVQVNDPGDLGYFIFADGEIFGPFDYSEPFITLGPFAGDGVTVYDFLILDFANPTCFGYVEVGPKSCDNQNDCQILELSAVPLDCNDNGTYDLELNIEVEEPQNELLFWFYLNGDYIGQSTLEALPGTLINLPVVNTGTVNFKACIFDQPDCCIEVEYIEPDCFGNACEIVNITSDFAYCDDEGFYVALDFETGAQPLDGTYKIFGNGAIYDTLSYDEPRPVVVGPFDPNTDNIYELIIGDLGNGDCQGFTEFVAFDCPPDTSNCVDFEPFAGFQSPPADGTGELEEVGVQSGVFFGYTLADFCLCAVEVIDSDSLNFFPAAEGQVVEFTQAQLLFEFAEAAEEVSFDYSVQETDIFFSDGDLNTLGLLDTLPENTPVVLPSGNTIERIPYNPAGDFTESSHIIITGDLDELYLMGSGFIDNLCWIPTTQEVWPGDANADNLAHHIDLLSIGLGYGVTGPERVNQDNSWSPAVALDWDSTFVNGTNYKHADCNGDGIIDEQDRLVIEANYGLEHGAPEPITELPGTDLDPAAFIDFPIDQPDGATFQAPIVIGTEAAPVEDAYGVAFTVYFDPEVISPDAIEIVYPTSWFGEPDINTLYIDKVYPDGRIEIALTRIDQNNVSGHGQVAYIIGIIDDIAGLTASDVSVEHVFCIDADEERLPIQGSETIFKIVSNTEPDAGKGVFRLFPNPTTDWVNVSSPHGFEIDQLQLLNLNGQQLPVQVDNNQRVSLANLPSGIYLVRITSGQTIVHKRVVKE